MSACRRTADILDAWLDAGRLNDRDAGHVAGCRHCADGLARVDVADAEIRTAVRSLALEPAAVGIGSTAPVGTVRRAKAPVRFPIGLASLAAIVVLAVVVGIRMFSGPAAPGAPVEMLLPVAVEPAEQALHQSGLRCAESATGLECTRRLADGWQQVARLDVTDRAVRRLEVRLVPGTAAFPVRDVPAALNEPATDVLGVDLSAAIDEALAADGIACGCTRPIEGGTVRLEGDSLTGYLVTIEAVR